MVALGPRVTEPLRSLETGVLLSQKTSYWGRLFCLSESSWVSTGPCRGAHTLERTERACCRKFCRPLALAFPRNGVVAVAKRPLLGKGDVSFRFALARAFRLAYRGFREAAKTKPGTRLNQCFTRFREFPVISAFKRRIFSPLGVPIRGFTHGQTKRTPQLFWQSQVGVDEQVRTGLACRFHVGCWRLEHT